MTFVTYFNAAFGSQTQDIDPTTALLIRARGFIERSWCRKWFAGDANGWGVTPVSEQAIAWCMTGALMAAQQQTADGCVNDAIERLRSAVGGDGTLADFNDRQQTVEPVLAAFDFAILDAGT